MTAETAAISAASQIEQIIDRIIAEKQQQIEEGHVDYLEAAFPDKMGVNYRQIDLAREANALARNKAAIVAKIQSTINDLTTPINKVAMLVYHDTLAPTSRAIDRAYEEIAKEPGKPRKSLSREIQAAIRSTTLCGYVFRLTGIELKLKIERDNVVLEGVEALRFHVNGYGGIRTRQQRVIIPIYNLLKYGMAQAHPEGEERKTLSLVDDHGRVIVGAANIRTYLKDHIAGRGLYAQIMRNLREMFGQN